MNEKPDFVGQELFPTWINPESEKYGDDHHLPLVRNNSGKQTITYGDTEMFGAPFDYFNFFERGLVKSGEQNMNLPLPNKISSGTV